MKYRVELLAPKAGGNGFGEEEQQFAVSSTVWAERVKLTGFRSEEVGEHFADYRAEFNIRSAHTVAPGWRLRQLGGLEYNITNVIPNIDRGMLTLVCERLNP